MRKIDSKGMMGIGTLIIFIAVILVAAVAAAVLVATAGSLQQRGIATGSQTEDAVATGAESISVMATDASSDHTVENFELLLRSQAGSDAINLNTTVMMVDTSTTSQSLDYGGTGTAASGTITYIIEYVKSGPEQEDGYMTRGDIIKAYFSSTTSVAESKKVRIKVIPRVGTTTIIEFTTPDVMTDQRITLWP